MKLIEIISSNDSIEEYNLIVEYGVTHESL
jgi:hypothetical protein